MALSKLGDFIESIDNRNSNQLIKTVFGLNNKKEFMPTVASIDENSDLSKYKIVEKGMFVFSGMQTGRDQNIRIGYSIYDLPFVISPAYTTFKVKNILPTYFFMIFKSSEMDRYGSFLSDSSVRSNLEWEVFCNIEIDIPSIEAQQKVVDVYLAMLANQKVFERGLYDLKLVFESSVEKLRKEYEIIKAVNYFNERTEVNSSLNEYVMKGVGQSGFINPVQLRTKESLAKCNIFYKYDFVYNPSAIMTGAIAISTYDDPMLCTEEYIVFYVKNPNKLLPKFVFIFLKRAEFIRYIWFSKIDSVRNRVYFDDLIDMLNIPLPPMEIQKSIVDIYEIYEKHIKIKEKLKYKINDLCPILIKGSIS